MTRASFRWAVALDGGTSNTRARLLRNGEVVATAQRAVGVRDSVLSGAPKPVAAAVRDAIAEVVAAYPGIRPDIIVAAGMLSSEVGLMTVPHVVAPAGLDDLARGAQVRRVNDAADGPILFIPGVRTPSDPGTDGWADADVMRGEECETIGAWSLLEARRQRIAATRPRRPAKARSTTAFLWPGSHTKLVEVDGDGRIVRSHTTLAGELTQALARHTLLAASLPPTLPDEPDAEAVAAGARLVERDGLGRAAFLIRIAALTDALDAHRRASFWVGAVIADDVAHLARHAILKTASSVWIGGRQPQRSLCAERLREHYQGPVREIRAAHASARGAMAVARRHQELFGS